MRRFAVAPLAAMLILSMAESAVAQTATDPRPAPSAIPTQPQGPTGPLNTDTTKGAPAESPQGETPPGMQSAPQGSSAVIPTRPDEKKK
jgi:glucose/arabinose dehydrogenase